MTNRCDRYGRLGRYGRYFCQNYAEKKELKVGPKIAPVAIFTIENGFLACRTLYKQHFKVRLADVQIVTVDVGGLLGTKGTLRLIGGGVQLAEELLCSSTQNKPAIGFRPTSNEYDSQP